MEKKIDDILVEMVEKDLKEYEIWISDFKSNGALKKNIRNVKPQQVIIQYFESDKDHFRDKYIDRRYMGEKEIHFKYFSKNNMKPLTKSIVNNSNIYIDEISCKEGYDNLIYKQIKYLQDEKNKIDMEIEGKIETLKKSFTNTDYLMEELSKK